MLWHAFCHVINKRIWWWWCVQIELCYLLLSAYAWKIISFHYFSIVYRVCAKKISDCWQKLHCLARLEFRHLCPVKCLCENILNTSLTHYASKPTNRNFYHYAESASTNISSTGIRFFDWTKNMTLTPVGHLISCQHVSRNQQLGYVIEIR